MMPSNIFVTGYGIYSALGKGADQNFQQLKNETHGLGFLDILKTKYANEFPFGEIKKSTDQLASEFGIQTKTYTRTSLLGMHAVHDALEMANLPNKYPTRIGFINASSVGGMCEVEKYYFGMLQEDGDYSRYSDTIDLADCTHRIADQFGFKHFITTISTACSSAANAIMLGARLLQHDRLDIVICGGTDALTRFTINGFNALKNIDKNPCKPFDHNRAGLNLGEGAAYLVMERENTMKQRNVQPLVTLSGYANFNEAFHPTAPNPFGEGSFQVMRRALAKAHLQTTSIDYINAHGTATITNDESESNAMKRLFLHVPAFSSTKCYTGHTLAAAGAIEAVFSIMSIQHQCVFANKHFETPIAESMLIPQLHFESNKNIQHVMTNSYAFGGNNASLIFSKT
jgi:3-oxoacyl-(acyl-carrier-protein) synthase